jgi:hypothetical protein
MTRARQRLAGRRLVLLVPLIAAPLAAQAAEGESPPVAEGAASAQPKTSATWLSWHPPPECPGPEFVLERVRGWLGGTLPEQAGLSASGQVHWTGEQWEIAVLLQLGETTGERRVRVATCADAAEFLAVAIVLAVDPSRGAELPALEEAETSALEVPEDPELGQATRSSEPSRPVESDGPATSRHQASSSWFLVAGIEGVVGALPSFQVGPLVEGGVQLGRLSLAAGAHFLPPVAQSPADAVAPISYALAAGRLGACYLPRLGPFDLGPCAQLDVGALWTNQPAPGDVSEQVPWVDVQLGAMARVFGPRVSLALGARLSIPLTQPLFVVSSGEAAHQPGIGMVLDARMQFFFGRR